MKITTMVAGFSLWFAALGGMPGANADELVQVAQHRAAAGPANSDATSPLLGFLTRPSGPGRFPAVILLHGCFGFDGHDTEAAATLKTWGYVGLALDSLGDANLCGRMEEAGTGAELLDAYAGLRYLTAQSFVVTTRIAVMGYSMGGTAALVAVEQGGFERGGQARFRAAIAYYPACGASSGVLTTPTLILVGENDDWSPAAACRKLAAHESDFGTTRDAAKGTQIDLAVHPNATHAFDYRYPPLRYKGHFIQRDEAAARDAEARVRAFLEQVLGEQAEQP
jgi:dienelactone hydrolase